MILVDTAPLISLFDASQKYHSQCIETYKSLSQPMLTTWCCFTETMYFLHKLRGWQGQNTLWKFLESNALHLHQTTSSERLRMKQLMKRYQNIPMDLADASLVATAESLDKTTIFTLDSDFFIYRLHESKSFDVIPKIN